MEGGRDRRPSSSPLQSPFPFGTPITNSDRSLLGPGRYNGHASESQVSPAGLNSSQSSVQHVIRGRVRAQDVYGGPLIFGGNSSLRRSRLMSASPYQGAASQRFSNRMSMAGRDASLGAYDSKPKLSNAPTPSTSKSTTPTSDDGMSSTARLIFDTLEKMSTPVRDAQKIPLIGRAEKRRQVMSELESSLVQTAGSGAMQSSKRHRPNLCASSTSISNNRTLLNGPPLRTLISPVTTPRSRSTAVKSARLAASTPVATSSSSFVTNPSLATKPSTPFSNVSAISSSKAFDTASGTMAGGETRQSQLATNVNKYQIPFSVPALTGGVATSTSSKREPAKPSAPPSLAPTFSSDQSRTGKIRTKLGEKAIELEDENSQPEVLPPHLLNPTSSGLELKQLPNFGFFSAQPPNNGSSQSTSNPLLNSPGHGSSSGALSKSSSETADTILLSPVRRTASSFSFSEPEVVTPNPNTGSFSSKMNGENTSAKFTFSRPEEIAPAESNRHLNSNNHFVMPDVMSSTFLTSSTPSNNFSSTKSRLKEMPSIQSLKSGSVMDILGGNNKLPDVTASTGGKISAVSSSSWDTKFKIGQNHWTS